MSRIRLVPIVVIVLVTLAVLIGGLKVYQHYNLVTPLQASLLRNPAVQSVQVEPGSPTDIQIHLNPVSKLDNRDLQTTYVQLTTTVRTLTGGSATVTIIDHRDGQLDADYEQLQPIFAEGLRKGNYIHMISAADKQAQADKIQSRITMDQQNVYVQLWTAHHYLYDVWNYAH